MSERIERIERIIQSNNEGEPSLRIVDVLRILNKISGMDFIEPEVEQELLKPLGDDEARIMLHDYATRVTRLYGNLEELKPVWAFLAEGGDLLEERAEVG